MYLKRKSFAFNSDRPGAGGEEGRDIFERALKTVDLTFQNLDSSEISLTDVSHYFDSDPTKLVGSLRADGKAPSAYIADTTTANGQVRGARARRCCCAGGEAAEGARLCARCCAPAPPKKKDTHTCTCTCTCARMQPPHPTTPPPPPPHRANTQHTTTNANAAGAHAGRDGAPGRAHQAAQPQVV
jgi:hypothetical protein